MSDDDDLPDDWPPPAGELWLVHGSMGAPIATMDGDGTGRAVLLRVAARQNHGTDELDATFVLELDDYVQMFAGLMSVGHVAFGREALLQEMSKVFDVPEDKRARAVRAFQAVMKDDDEQVSDERDRHLTDAEARFIGGELRRLGYTVTAPAAATESTEGHP